MVRQAFYDSVRQSVFGGKITSSQFQGMEADLNKWEISGLTDLRWLAYMLGTDYHETAATMQPISERGGNAYFVRKYWDNKRVRGWLGNLSPQDAIDYAGKGKVQITGRGNYAKMGRILSLPLLQNPNLAKDMKVATDIMFEGMTTGKSFAGDFTGKHLGNYFNKTVEDWVGARSIINPGDKGELVATIAKKFYAGLLLATC